MKITYKGKELEVQEPIKIEDRQAVVHKHEYEHK